MGERLVLEASWQDLVFHVLAHIPVPSSVPASLWDNNYVKFVGGHLGPAGGRRLGQDAPDLARVFATHERLAGVQRLAWLFDDLMLARAAGDRGLGALSAAQACDPDVLSQLASDTVGAELLWAAALLELDAYCSLPTSTYDPAPLARELAHVSRAAPYLSRCRLRHARALGRRGRVTWSEIWLGLPTDPQHCAWQAGHEATVAEVNAQGRRVRAAREMALASEPSNSLLGERDTEAVAMVLLSERSQRAGLQAEHAQFCNVWGIAPEHLAVSALTTAQRTRYEELATGL